MRAYRIAIPASPIVVRRACASQRRIETSSPLSIAYG